MSDPGDVHIHYDDGIECDTILYAYAGYDVYLEAYLDGVCVRKWSVATARLPRLRESLPGVRFERKKS